jgi:hypothetical protein
MKNSSTPRIAMVVFVFSLFAAIASPAQTFTTVYNFCSLFSMELPIGEGRVYRFV